MIKNIELVSGVSVVMMQPKCLSINELRAEIVEELMLCEWQKAKNKIEALIVIDTNTTI